MPKSKLLRLKPGIKSNREFQTRLIANIGILNERLQNIQAALAVIADCVQAAKPEWKSPTNNRVEK